jgi:RNA polymerase sigma factor (sigma-70 family)
MLAMTEEEIINAICSTSNEQRRAFHELYSTKGPDFRRFFRYKGAANEDADELIQEVIIKIFKNARNYSGQGAFSDNSANAWMWAIARNTLNDYFIKNNHRVGLSAGSLNDDKWFLEHQDQLTKGELGIFTASSERVGEIEIENCVSRGIEDFYSKEPDRAMVLIMQMDGYNIESIAKKIHRTTNAAKQYLSQCRIKLKPYIQHCMDLVS